MRQLFWQAQAERLLIEGESAIEGNLWLFSGRQRSMKFDFKRSHFIKRRLAFLDLFGIDKISFPFSFLVAKLKAEAAEVELVAELESKKQVICEKWIVVNQQRWMSSKEKLEENSFDELNCLLERWIFSRLFGFQVKRHWKICNFIL